MGVIADRFSLRLGTPLGVNSYTPTHLVDQAPEVAGFTVGTISPGGFESLQLSLGAQPTGTLLPPTPFGDRYSLVRPFGHCELWAGRARLFEGRIMQPTFVGGRLTGFLALGYGVSATTDGFINTSSNQLATPRGLLELIRQTVPAFAGADYEAPYEPGILSYQVSNGLTPAQALDALSKFGTINNEPLGWWVWDRRRLSVKLLNPPALTDYVIPEDETVTVNVDVRDTAGAVTVVYTDSATGSANQTDLITNPDFVFDFGVNRTRTVNGGILTAAQADQYAAVWLAQHSQPTYQVAVTRGDGHTLGTAGGGERSAYLARSGEWVQVGTQLPPLPIVRTRYTAPGGQTQIDLGAPSYTWQGLVHEMRVQLQYFISQTHPNTGMPY